MRKHEGKKKKEGNNQERQNYSDLHRLRVFEKERKYADSNDGLHYDDGIDQNVPNHTT